MKLKHDVVVVGPGRAGLQHQIHQLLARVGRSRENDLSEQIRNGTHLVRAEKGIVKRTDTGSVSAVLAALIHSLVPVSTLS